MEVIGYQYIIIIAIERCNVYVIPITALRP